MIIQLNPPIPVNSPKGPCLAHFMIDYGPEHNIMWVVFQDDTGECWTWPNPDIRAQKNVTMGRKLENKDPPGLHIFPEVNEICRYCANMGKFYSDISKEMKYCECVSGKYRKEREISKTLSNNSNH